MGRRPAEIVAAIQREDPSLLEGLRRPYEAIAQDIGAIRNEDAKQFQSGGGLPALTAYLGRQTYLMTMAISASESLQGSPKVRAMQLAGEYSRDVARVHGVPTDRPALPLDLGQLSTPHDGQETPEGPSRGTVDPVTFATDPYFCGLSLDRFPLQSHVLEEFFSPQKDHDELICVCGMRSGKGVLASVISWYQAYVLLQLDDPQSYYGLASGQEIRIINMAISEDQARRNVFRHILDRYETGGPWFRQPDVVLGEPKTLEIRLAKNITIVCGHSRATSKLGGTYILAVLDELARMKDTEGRDNAHEIYTKMRASTRSFGSRGRLVVITSPEWEGDEAMQLLELAGEVDEEGHRRHSRMLPVHLPTWEANLNITREMLADDERRNPTAFWRDFGARPPTAVEAYYPDPERWVRQADPDRRHPFDDQGRLADWFSPAATAAASSTLTSHSTATPAASPWLTSPSPAAPTTRAETQGPTPRPRRSSSTSAAASSLAAPARSTSSPSASSYATSRTAASTSRPVASPSTDGSPLTPSRPCARKGFTVTPSPSIATSLPTTPSRNSSTPTSSASTNIPFSCERPGSSSCARAARSTTLQMAPRIWSTVSPVPCFRH
jgi:hypothetical protein